MTDNIKCPGCGEDFGQDRHGLADHINDCEYPLEERLTFEVEVRKLNDPNGVERYTEYDEGSFAFIGKGAFIPSRYGVLFKVGKSPDDCDVYYVKHSDLLGWFLDAVKKSKV